MSHASAVIRSYGPTFLGEQYGVKKMREKSRLFCPCGHLGRNNFLY
jgi:hypothetical protein